MSEPAITPEDDLVGIRLVHMNTGDVVRVRCRKSTDDGWWVHDGGGLCDEVIADGTWRPLMVVLAEVERLSGEVERLRAERDEAQLRSIEARNPGIDMAEVRRVYAAARLHAEHGHICDPGSSPNCGHNPCTVHLDATLTDAGGE